MKAIINGRRYDTDTAILIAMTDNIDGQTTRRDFRYWEAGLYKTPRSGVYFLAGRGGPMTVFARKVGVTGREGGERIIPFESREDALAWAQEHLADRPDVIEREFGDLIANA
jgi:hypothetical protein